MPIPTEDTILVLDDATYGVNTEFDPVDGTYTTTFGADELASSAETCRTEIDLYDSGASRHTILVVRLSS